MVEEFWDEEEHEGELVVDLVLALADLRSQTHALVAVGACEQAERFVSVSVDLSSHPLYLIV